MSRTKGAVGNTEWRDAVRKAAHELRDIGNDGKPKKVKALSLMARSLVKRGLDGDVAAVREIGDRLDGRAVQAVEIAVPVAITRIEHHIIAPKTEAAEAVVAASAGKPDRKAAKQASNGVGSGK